MQTQPILQIINDYNVSRKLYVNDKLNQMYINKYINKIYIINLHNNILRKNYVIKLMEKYNINFELIIVPTLSNEEYEIINNKHINLGEAGCYLSHMFCLNDAIINNYQKIIIFEDDIILHKQFHLLFENITSSDFEFDFDILMLGCDDFHFRKLNYKFVENNLYKPHNNTTFLYGTFSIMYSSKGLREMFTSRLNKPTFMDNNLIEFSNKFRTTFFISYPNLVLTDYSQTNINHNFWITNKLKEKYYLKNCFDDKFNFTDYNFIYLKPLELSTSVDLSKSYAENMMNILKLFFKTDINSANIIYMRLVYDFFNVQDLEFISFIK